ncbi:MAG: response regulator [Acidobacteriota bacterium]
MTEPTTLRALLVDEDPTWRLLLSISLRDAGFEVRTAADNDTADGLLRLLTVDAVIVDLHPPTDAGLELIGRIERSTSAPPVVALLPKRSAELERKCLGSGAQLCLFKPMKAREFTESVRTACRASREAPS